MKSETFIKIMTKEEIIDLYLTGNYIQFDIAKLAGISRARVYEILNDNLDKKVIKKIIYQQRIKRWKGKKPKK